MNALPETLEIDGEMYIKPTPKLLAEAFVSFNGEHRAQFFDEVAKETLMCGQARFLNWKDIAHHMSKDALELVDEWGHYLSPEPSTEQ